MGDFFVFVRLFVGILIPPTACFVGDGASTSLCEFRTDPRRHCRAGACPCRFWNFYQTSRQGQALALHYLLNAIKPQSVRAADLPLLSSLKNSRGARHGSFSYAIVAAITALMVCIRFSASSNTIDCGPSNTSSVTSIQGSPNLS